MRFVVDEIEVSRAGRAVPGWQWEGSKGRPARLQESHSWRAVLAGCLVFAFALLVAASIGHSQQPAGQPSSVNPTASAVKEQQLLDALKPGGQGAQAVSGRVSIPDKRSGTLIQPAGRDWRAMHQRTLPFYGAVAILGMLALVTVFYLLRGRVRVAGGFSGQTMTRFGFIERFAHWLTAISFLALGLTGLNITFGRSLLLPLVGHEAFASLTQLGKLVHNYGSFAFCLGLVLMFLLWVKDNIPHPRDVLWIVKGGGLLGLHVDAERFNFGQKIIFWVVILGGAGLAYTGYNMMFPFVFADVAGMQWFTIVHGLIGVVMIAVIIGHIYIGTLGMDGAFQAMGSGQVDVNWAREHHALWVEREQARTVRRDGPAGAPAE